MITIKGVEAKPQNNGERNTKQRTPTVSAPRSGNARKAAASADSRRRPDRRALPRVVRWEGAERRQKIAAFAPNKVGDAPTRHTWRAVLKIVCNHIANARQSPRTGRGTRRLHKKPRAPRPKGRPCCF